MTNSNLVDADRVQVDPASGIVRIDGLPVFRVIAIPGNGVIIQFKDHNQVRSEFRGSPLIEIPIDVLFETLVVGSA